MSYGLPPIVKLAEALMRDLELAVSRFPRRFRYTVGAQLTQDAFNVATAAHRAWRAPTDSLEGLSEAIDRLKLRMQLAQQIHAFASFAQFEALARAAANLGKQCGGWAKRMSKRQNGETQVSTQRPQILSSRSASSEAST